MLKKTMVLTAVAAAALLIGGCSTVQTSSAFKDQKITNAGTDVAHITSYASGFYFLWFPIITGSAENPGSTVFGENSCNVTALTSAVTKKSKELGASKTVDLVSTQASNTLPIPIPFLFSFKTAQVSCNAVK